ncbi:MAG TPA: YdcF family protein [Stellaceae bacterium]|nr:YdcF family protein [Stellaceae bacterium]
MTRDYLSHAAVANPFSFGILALPTVFITLSLAGALMALVWRRAGIVLTLASSLCLYAAATPALSSYLLSIVEAALPHTVDLGSAQAIVVLGGDVRRGNGADIPDTLGRLSLERVVWGAEAYRRLHLPVVVSGGRVRGAQASEGSLMKAALAADFAVPVGWSEERSRTTWENAVYTAQLLLPEKLTTVVVVSQAWHLPRALWAFERAGLTALPWPAPRTALRLGEFGDFLPSLGALNDTFDALHELIGGAYYRMRH